MDCEANGRLGKGWVFHHVVTLGVDVPSSSPFYGTVFVRHVLVFAPYCLKMYSSVCGCNRSLFIYFFILKSKGTRFHSVAMERQRSVSIGASQSGATLNILRMEVMRKMVMVMVMMMIFWMKRMRS